MPALNAARINTAIDEILGRCALLPALDTTPYFNSCARGAIMTVENVKISQLALFPALRAWLQPTEFNMGASDFVIAGDVGGKSGITQLLDLDVYLYSTDKDADGVPLDLQSRLVEIEEAMILWLKNSPDASVPWATFSDTVWGFTRGQKVKGSFGTAMKKFGSRQIVAPPWYTLTLTVSIDVYPA